MNTNTTNKVQVGESTTGTKTSTTASQWQAYNHYNAERGWECPRCGHINAPWVRQCDCSGNTYWYPTWERPYYDEWWKHVTWTPETTWKAPSNVCSSDSKSNPNSNIYTTATNPTVGGSDYWNSVTKTWENVPKTETNKTIDYPNNVCENH